MKRKAFKISYSFIVNGDEYPREIVLVDINEEAAVQQLKSMVGKADQTAEVIISGTSLVTNYP